MTLKNLADGRLLLQFNGKHMWLNTPNQPKVFSGENVYDLIHDYAYWLTLNAGRLNWLSDSDSEVIDIT